MVTEVEALKKAVAEAEKRATTEQALREKYEARVIKAGQELQEVVKKCETLEQSLTEKESELTKAHQAAPAAQGETQGALQEIQEARKIAAGKAFFHVKQVFEEKIMFLILNSDFSRGICGAAPQHIRCRPILPSRRKGNCG
jgi:chromosome segregation ATPase